MNNKPEPDDDLPCDYMVKIPKSHRYACSAEERGKMCLRPLHYATCEIRKKYQI